MAVWAGLLLAQAALPRFDYSINPIEALAVPVLLYIARVLWKFRDDFRDMKRTVGNNGEDGQKKTGLCLQIEEHHAALKAAGWLDRRTTERRTH